MPVNVCVPVLRRYDMLGELITSLERSTRRPDALYLIDNGRNQEKMNGALNSIVTIPVLVHTPPQRMGVAESWNWFLMNVDEERIISNDDILFAPESIERLVEQPHDLVWGSGFSCFVIRDSCVEKLGMFDESISPGYGYYEDDDYLQRLDGRGTKPRNATAENVSCGIVHRRSSTLQAAEHKEVLEHHRLFKIAQGNYMRKWGLTSI